MLQICKTLLLTFWEKINWSWSSVSISWMKYSECVNLYFCLWDGNFVKNLNVFFFPHAYGWEGSKMVSTRCFQVTHSKFVTLYMEVQEESLGFCTLQCSFCVLAEFVLAVWVSDFSQGFSSICFNTDISQSDWLISQFLSFDFPGWPPEEKTEVWSWRSGQAVRCPGYWYSSW